jgi:hypothetical protein
MGSANNNNNLLNCNVTPSEKDSSASKNNMNNSGLMPLPN